MKMRLLMALAAVGSIAFSSAALTETPLVISVVAARSIYLECALPDFSSCGPSTPKVATVNGTVTFAADGVHVNGNLLGSGDSFDLLCDQSWSRSTMSVRGGPARVECRYLESQPGQKLRVEINIARESDPSQTIAEVLNFTVDENICAVSVRDATVRPVTETRYLAACTLK